MARKTVLLVALVLSVVAVSTGCVHAPAQTNGGGNHGRPGAKGEPPGGVIIVIRPAPEPTGSLWVKCAKGPCWYEGYPASAHSEFLPNPVKPIVGAKPAVDQFASTVHNILFATDECGFNFTPVNSVEFELASTATLKLEVGADSSTPPKWTFVEHTGSAPNGLQAVYPNGTLPVALLAEIVNVIVPDGNGGYITYATKEYPGLRIIIY